MSKKKSFNDLVNQTNNQLHHPKSIFGNTGVEQIKSVWIDKKWFIKLKLLTIKHDHTTVKYWANKAMAHAFKDGTLK